MANNTADVIDEPTDARRKYGLAPDAICRRLIRFTTNDWHLHKPGHTDELGRLLKEMRNPDSVVFIVGHASRTGGKGYNQTLSTQRAQEVFEYIKYRLDISKLKIEVHGEGKTETLGRLEDDPIDRAVVIVIQPGSAPRPLFIPPELPKRNPKFPDPPLPPPPEGFRWSGWRITSVSGLVGTVPAIGPLAVGLGVQLVELTNETRRKVANYSLDGIAGSVGSTKAADLVKSLPIIGKMAAIVLTRLKGRGLSVGPPQFHTYGTEVLVTPWVKEPVGAEEFGRFASIVGAGAALPGAGVSGNIIVFNMVGFMIPAAGAALGAATVVGVGAFAGPGINISPGGSLDAFHAKSFLKSVVPMAAATAH
jgi:hypothetical protein